MATLTSPRKSARPQSSEESEDNMWSGLLDSVASGKRLPEKNVLVLGRQTEKLRPRAPLTHSRRLEGATTGFLGDLGLGDFQTPSGSIPQETTGCQRICPRLHVPGRTRC
jgi:hypothetical protein